VPRIRRCLALLSATPVVLALPVLSRPLPHAHAVAPHVREHAVAGIDGTAGYAYAGPPVARPLALTRGVRSESFEALGVTWARGAGDVEVQARVRQHGSWTAWHLLDAESDDGPDTTSAENVRAGTSPWFTGPADGYQVRVGTLSGAKPRDVRVSLVDPGTSAADGTVGASPVLGVTAEAAPAKPSIVTRAQWGADESIRHGTPDYSSTIRMGFVHHTDTSNSYTSGQAAAMVRSVYAFHVLSRGWSDIGYNFLVDKFGRVFEGRYGGVDRPVIGAHTGGFNTDTFGVALLGTYTSVAPSSAEIASLQKVFAWKMSLHYVNPLSTSVLTSRGGTKYASGVQVRFNNVSGHRDAGLTSCPGNQVYSRLPSIRSGIRSRMGASLYGPTASTTTPLYLTTPSVTVRAGIPGAQSWRLLVRNARTGMGVTSLRGSGLTSVSATWDLKDTLGQLVKPDLYELELQSWTAYTQALPYKVHVDVRSPLPDGVTLSRTDGVPYALVDNGRMLGISAALAAALRPQPPIVAWQGPQRALGTAASAPRDGMYVRNGTGLTWLVVEGQRRPVTSPVASALGLPAARLLPDAVLTTVTAGPAWTITTRHPDGTVVTSGDSAWRIESGVRRGFTSPLSRAAWTKGVVVAAALPGDLALPAGAPLAPPEGMAAMDATGLVHVVSGGTWRPVPSPSSLGYATSAVLTDEDLAALPLGEPVTTHPSGTLLRNGTAYVEVVGTTKRAIDASLIALDPRVPLAPLPDELTSLGSARWVTPSGVAGVGADGVVRVVADGRLVSLSPATSHALGYDAVTLPLLEAADFGAFPVATSLTNHPSGTLVTDGTSTWLLDASTRRPVAASLLPAFLGRPAVAATATDLALPLGSKAGPPTGAWVRTEDGVRWLVDNGVRRVVSSTVAHRLGLDVVPTIDVVLADLTASTVQGPAVG
jgi:hypothetical protein